MTSSGMNGLNIRINNASPIWDRIMFQRSKRSLLASRLVANVLWKPPGIGYLTSKTLIKFSSVTRSRLVKCLINEGCHCI